MKLGAWLVPLFFTVALSACGKPESRSGNEAVKLEPPLGLPEVPIPADNPLTRAKIDLGRKLFMDRRLSHNNTMSCGMCHVPEQGFTSNELGAAIGMEGRSLRRNAPTIFNVAYMETMFHDGREFSLETQVWGPLLTSREMAMPSVGYVVEKIKIMPDYNGLFEAAFDGKGPSAELVGHAIASYERTLLSGASRFDRWRYGKDKSTLLNDEEARGFQLFTGKAGCATCHTIGEKYALFTDNDFHNTGLGWERSMHGVNRKHKVQLAPGVFIEVEDKALKSFEPPLPDVGRYEVTLNPADRWKYKTPSLRNVALTGPYMHDGSLQSLEQVVDFYDRGGIDNPEKDPRLNPLKLTGEEKKALVAFLKSLTGDNVEKLAADARSVAIDNPIPSRDPAAEFRRKPNPQ